MTERHVHMCFSGSVLMLGMVPRDSSSSEREKKKSLMLLFLLLLWSLSMSSQSGWKEKGRNISFM